MTTKLEEKLEFVFFSAGVSIVPELIRALLQQRFPGAQFRAGAELAGVPKDTKLLLVRRVGSERQLVIFFAPPNAETVNRLLADGSCSIVTLDASGLELDRALEVLDSGSPFIASTVIRAFAAPARTEAAHLSPREREVLRLLTRGYSNREIAEQLVLSPHTVRSHLQSISAKFGVSSRMKLAAEARQMRL